MDFDPSHDCANLVTVALKGDAPPTARGELLELDLSKFHAGRWAVQFDAAMTKRSEPVVLVARGVACLAVSWWAKLSPRSYLANIRGAIFVSPLTIGFGQAAIAAAARLSPAIKLPFPSIVASETSPIVDQVLALADDWGSRFVDSAAQRGGGSNRRGPGTRAEDFLLDLFNQLGGGAANNIRPIESPAARIPRAPPGPRG